VAGIDAISCREAVAECNDDLARIYLFWRSGRSALFRGGLRVPPATGQQQSRKENNV
jgi:hypothetical protein